MTAAYPSPWPPPPAPVERDGPPRFVSWAVLWPLLECDECGSRLLWLDQHTDLRCAACSPPLRAWGPLPVPAFVEEVRMGE